MNDNAVSDKCRDWIEYWSQDDFWKDSRLWEINSGLFFKQLSCLLEFNKNDTVLDIGCGSGYTEVYLSPLVKHVYAVDVSEQFVEICSRRCKDKANVTVGFIDKNDYTNLEHFGGSFSIFLCVSVVQYYKNIKEVEALILSAKKIASPGAKMLIEDLPLKRRVTGFMWDAASSFFMSLKGGYLWVLLCTALKRWAGITGYKSFCDKSQHLYFTVQELEDLIDRLRLNARIIKKTGSVYANRLSLLIQF